MATSSRMKLNSLHPFCFVIVWSSVVLLVPGLLIPLWINKVNGIESEIKFSTGDVHQELVLRIEKTAMLLSPLNQSAINLARLLSSLLGKTELQFSAIETRVAPVLFQALSTIPHLSQISFIAFGGLFFSYYSKGNQHFAVYSNTSFSTSLFAVANYTWYTRPVNCKTGKLYGEAMQTSPRRVLDAAWFQEALKSINGRASVGVGWDNDHDPLLLNTVSIGSRGALSLGFPAKSLTNFFADVSVYGGGLYLASKDGTVFSQGLPNTRMILAGNSVSFQLLTPNGDQIGHVGNLACQPNDGTSTNSILEIRKMKYLFQCSLLEIVGVQSVYALALPSMYEGPENFMHQNTKSAFVLLMLLVTAMVVSIFTFIVLTFRAARREMLLRAALIKQMEATQQAERKSMNTSLAYASASHDVRASLAGIIGLIEMCRAEVPPGSDLETILRQAEACTKDLLGILNSILDTSRIEAGRIQLEEEEFDLEQLVEDAVDLYHPVGMKKGVDVVLDTYDGSITKFSQVKGDRGKLKQILSNLLSNAVKFTSEGHVSVRVWAKNPSLESLILPSSPNNSMRCISCFQNDRTYRDLEVKGNVQQDQNCMEFIFEVNDTGKGIPKEKQKIVFENYVQVTEAASGQEGTGLGLGIVQSLVRLMGGEIAIVDKEFGEKGTCFRFNTFLTVCETETTVNSREDDLESRGGYLTSDYSYQHSGQSTRTLSPKAEGSNVILFISSEERSKILQKFMQRLGIKVSVVKQYQQLPHALKKIKEKLFLSHPSTSRRHDSQSISAAATWRSTRKEVPLGALDGADDVPFSHKRKNAKITSNFVLIVIDTSAGPFREVSRAVAEFRRDLSRTFSRVVWIDRPGARSMNVQQGLDADKLPSMDLIIYKPLHGSRLYQVVGLLPEFGGTLTVSEIKEEMATSNAKNVPPESIALAGKGKGHLQFTSRNSSAENLPTQDGEIHEIDEGPLSGKKVLVAEDNPVLRKISVATVSRLGANTYPCQDGEEALELVRQNLRDQREHRARYSLPFDYILMDCEMPVMNGYEASRSIREEEKHLGLHIPIIALTAHTANEETNKMIEAGMDYHLSKPLRPDQLLEAILHIRDK